MYNFNNFLISLKKDIILPSGQLNIPGILYTLAIPISLMGIITYIQTSMNSINNTNLFHIHDLLFSLSMLFLMILKIPYFHDKPIAFVQFIIFGILWAIATTLLIIAYNKTLNKK